MNKPRNPFDDPGVAARYPKGPPRIVPGYHAMQRMAMLLLAERAPEDARVLVLGAGGGMELKAFAEARPNWTLDGVDPSAEMLNLARQTLGPLVSRVRLREGYIEDAPNGPFDAASCLLTLNLVSPEDRLRTLVEIRRRLKPGAPFVMAHISVPGRADQRALWLSRHVAYAHASGVTQDNPVQAALEINRDLIILTPEQDEAILREAGFSDVALFYVGFTFRGWVARA